MVKRVIVELKAPVGFSMQAALDSEVAKLPGFKIDPDYGPVAVSSPKETVKNLGIENEKVFLIRGTIEDEKEEELKLLPNVLKVWSDARIEPF
jgi:hypothetical protein